MFDAAHDDGWLARFHEGDKRSIAQCYEDYFECVERAVGRFVQSPADRETLIHEVFYRILSQRELRENFGGGSFSSWISTVAKNLAIDYLRQRKREQPLTEEHLVFEAVEMQSKLEARQVIERFRETTLPPKWAPVFEARFVEQLSQREAARALEISRTTLAYREHRIRSLLKRFLLREDCG